jgi:uncharacterized protein YdiU (UPF0061 family)|tara:strand:- start:2159 stop:3643 length:1485 start_codon:yes stop_codon:yes gene_type:complete
LNATLFGFHNSYARLPEHFFARLSPTPVSDPRLVRINEDLAVRLKLDPAFLGSPEGVQILAGNRVPGDAEPLAMAYAGFQFGGWVPQLGDGRAILLGELADRDGVRHDVQLKGCGRTPFSRNGDGRAVLGPVLREYIVGEAMHALGVPTTRALAVVTTGEQVLREHSLPGAVLTRVAQSHIRVGTFQFFAARQDINALRLLADHVIDRHYPDARKSARPYLALLDAVVDAQAALVASWKLIGFIHGVMNTDNTSICGETIDYGPCAFMDTYYPGMVYSSIDQGGRYAYGNQAPIAHWNLAGFAQTLIPLIDSDAAQSLEMAQEIINTFPAKFEVAYNAGVREKLGFQSSKAEDPLLMADLLTIMADHQADFTLVFRRLCLVKTDNSSADGVVRALFDDPAAFDQWAARWRVRLGDEVNGKSGRQQRMLAANPAYIPRNHRVEEVIRAAEDHGDFAPFEKLHRVLQKPYDEQESDIEYQRPPRPEEIVQATFCGT